MDVVERGDTSLKKAAKYWNILMTSFFNHFNGRIRCRKVELPRCVNKIGGWSNGYLGSKHAKGWIICQPSIVKNEGCKNHPHQTNPISE